MGWPAAAFVVLLAAPTMGLQVQGDDLSETMRERLRGQLAGTDWVIVDGSRPVEVAARLRVEEAGPWVRVVLTAHGGQVLEQELYEPDPSVRAESVALWVRSTLQASSDLARARDASDPEPKSEPAPGPKLSPAGKGAGLRGHGQIFSGWVADGLRLHPTFGVRGGLGTGRWVGDVSVAFGIAGPVQVRFGQFSAARHEVRASVLWSVLPDPEVGRPSLALGLSGAAVLLQRGPVEPDPNSTLEPSPARSHGYAAVGPEVRLGYRVTGPVHVQLQAGADIQLGVPEFAFEAPDGRLEGPQPWTLAPRAALAVGAVWGGRRWQ